MRRQTLGMALTAALAAVLTFPAPTIAHGPPTRPATSPSVDSRPDADAPELAALGPYAVGVHSITLTAPNTPDVLSRTKDGRSILTDRRLLVDLWYPALPRRGSKAVVYQDSLPSEEEGRRKAFSIQGLAVRDASPDRRGPYPLLVVSHGFSGSPAALSWIAENMASKGYVVAAPHHEDPPITDPSGFVGPVFLRPVDIAFVAHALQSGQANKGPLVGGLIDPDRVALMGYSMGGYGVLTVAGAGLSPEVAARVPGGALTPYARGGVKADALRVPGLKAVVAISPAGGGGAFSAWGKEGLASLTTPTLLLVGDHDEVVGFDPGVKSVFDAAVNAPRYMLVFQNGGHSIGMDAAPASMRGAVWDLDWFEDPVWRKERVISVSLHMITAFLDVYVKGDAAKSAFLDLSPASSDAVWPGAGGKDSYGAFSSGSGGVTVWKGFQRRHAVGLSFYKASAAQKTP